MKAAIPTNDGLMMASTFGEARGFLVVNIELGKVTREELIWKQPEEKSIAPDIYMDLLKDCSAVIAGEVADPYKAMLEKRNISIIPSRDKIISNVIMNYMEHEAGKLADTCCCP